MVECFRDCLFRQTLYPEYYLLKINQFDGTARDLLDEWIYFLKNGEIEEDFRAKGLRKAKEEVLAIMNLDKEERLAYEWHAEEMRYQLSMYRSNFLDGQMEGEERGMEKGKKEGREEGRKEGRIEAARLMKQVGEPVEKMVVVIFEVIPSQQWAIIRYYISV